MMTFFNERYISNSAQFEKMRLIELQTGRSRGAQIIELENANSLRIEVVIDRALDIVAASLLGKNLVWLSPLGVVSNQNLNLTEIAWLNNWSGGLVTTGGLDHALGPDTDETSFNYPLLKSRQFPIHGRISYQPAENFQFFESKNDSDPLFVVRGQMNQVTVFGEYLTLDRTILFGRNNNLISIFDRVINKSSESTDHMFLYHCNFGWPLIQPGVQINRISADNKSEKLLEIKMPETNSPETVLVDPVDSNQDFTHIQIENKKIDIDLHHIFPNKNFNFHLQWLVSRPDFMVYGSEASTNDLSGRKAAREKSLLKNLKQNEQIDYQSHFYVDAAGRISPAEIKGLIRARTQVWERIKEQS